MGQAQRSEEHSANLEVRRFGLHLGLSVRPTAALKGIGVDTLFKGTERCFIHSTCRGLGHGHEQLSKAASAYT